MTYSELSDFLSDVAPTPLFHPKAKKEKMEAQVIRYSGEKYLNGIPTQDDIVNKKGENLTTNLEDALSKQQDIPFMTFDHEGSSEKIQGKYYYVLRLYGSLINGQKAVVTFLGIQAFFDIRVLDGKSPDTGQNYLNRVLIGY